MKRLLGFFIELFGARGGVPAGAAFSPDTSGIGVRHIVDARFGRLSPKAVAVCALLTLGVVDWIWAWYAGLAFVHWQPVGLVLTFLMLLGLFYSASGRDKKLADMANYGALWIAFTAVAAIFTYLTASLRLPLRDAGFASIDSALGFNWLVWFHFVRAHPLFNVILKVAYPTLMIQIVGSLIYFSHLHRPDRNDELWWCAMVSLFVTAIISGIFPALGAFITFGVPELAEATHLPHLLALRDGSVSSFALKDMQGIITLPSYHTVLAILLIYVHRGQRRWFPAVAVINGLMLVSVPSEGGHYLSDMIAGGAVAILAILVVRITLRSPQILRNV